MFKIIVFIAVIAVAQSIPLDRPENEFIRNLKSNSEVTENGGYTFSFESGDGSFREESAVPVNVGQEDAYFVITGSYKYIVPNSKNTEVHYTAGKNGFIPIGGNVPSYNIQEVPAVPFQKV